MTFFKKPFTLFLIALLALLEIGHTKDLYQHQLNALITKPDVEEVATKTFFYKTLKSSPWELISEGIQRSEFEISDYLKTANKIDELSFLADELKLEKYAISLYYPQHLPKNSFDKIFLIIPGAGSDSRTFEQSAIQLSKEFNTLIIVPDVNGMGNSYFRNDKVITTTELSSQGIARQVRFLIETLGINVEKTILLGHSMGAVSTLYLYDLPFSHIYAIDPGYQDTIYQSFYRAAQEDIIFLPFPNWSTLPLQIPFFRKASQYLLSHILKWSGLFNLVQGAKLFVFFRPLFKPFLKNTLHQMRLEKRKVPGVSFNVVKIFESVIENLMTRPGLQIIRIAKAANNEKLPHLPEIARNKITFVAHSEDALVDPDSLKRSIYDKYNVPITLLEGDHYTFPAGLDNSWLHQHIQSILDEKNRDYLEKSQQKGLNPEDILKAA